MLNILTFSTLYPNAVEPHHGIFTETSLRQQLRLHPMRAVAVSYTHLTLPTTPYV